MQFYRIIIKGYDVRSSKILVDFFSIDLLIDIAESIVGCNSPKERILLERIECYSSRYCVLQAPDALFGSAWYLLEKNSRGFCRESLLDWCGGLHKDFPELSS